jgi:hypothetical protein
VLNIFLFFCIYLYVFFICTLLFSLSLSLSLSIYIYIYLPSFPPYFPILLIICVVCSSFNKKSNSAQGGQYRVNPSPVNSTESNNAPAARGTHNGTHVQSQLHGKL